MSGTGRTATVGRWALVAAVLVLLVVPGRLLASEHERDDALAPYTAAPAAARIEPGRTWHVDAGVATADAGVLRLVAVRPRVTIDTAEADITVRLCRSTGPQPVGCRDLADARAGGVVRLAHGAARLVVSVTPRRVGRVQIEGYDVTYLDAGHRGTEHAGREAVLRAG